jgi:glycosyltransferase involved in cell wall biosynthesis
VKVALVGPYPLDVSSVCGGIEAATYYLAQGLRQYNDLDLHVFSVTKKIESDRDVHSEGLTIHYLAEPRTRVIPNLVTNIWRLRKAVDKLQPDVVHGEHPSGTLAGIRGGYPTVHTIHGIIHRELRLARGPKEYINQVAFRYVSDRAVSAVRYAIAVSPYARDQYKHLTKADIRVIPNALEDDFFRIRESGMPGRILSVGYICARKDYIGLVRAFSHVKRVDPNAELIIVGGVKDKVYYSELLRCIADLELENCVRLPGFISQDALNDEYAKASVVCMYSQEESFSIVVSQGMAAGKPVISTDSGGPSYLINDGDTGFLIPLGDEKAFAARCVELLADARLRRTIGEKARKVALARFSKEIVAQSTVEVYKEMLR